MSGVDRGSRSVLATSSGGFDEALDRTAPAADTAHAPALAVPTVDADASSTVPDSAASNGGGSSPRAQEVMDYLTKHELTQKLNDAVNAVVKARSDDPIGFMAEEFIKYAKPMTISRLVGSEVLDSCGLPTVQVDVYTNVHENEKILASATIATSDFSSQRDQDMQHYIGLGVKQAVDNVTTVLSEALKNLPLVDLSAIDSIILKQHSEKVSLNSAVAASFAVTKAAAISLRKELFELFTASFSGDNARAELRMPCPIAAVLRCGKEIGSSSPFLHFHVIPAQSSELDEQVRQIATVYQLIGRKLANPEELSTRAHVDEFGAFVSTISSCGDALRLLEEVIESSGFKMSMGMSVNASAMFDSVSGQYEIEAGKKLDAAALASYFSELFEAHPTLMFIEDPFDASDIEAWTNFCKAMGDKLLIVGASAFASDPERIKKGADNAMSNAVVIDVGEAGTFTQAMDAARAFTPPTADADNQAVIVSCGGRQSIDSTIVDFSVGIGANYIKIGAPCRGEHVSKYNRLLAIWHSLALSGRP